MCALLKNLFLKLYIKHNVIFGFLDSPHKIFIGGLPNYLNEEQVCKQVYDTVLLIAHLWKQFLFTDVYIYIKILFILIRYFFTKAVVNIINYIFKWHQRLKQLSRCITMLQNYFANSQHCELYQRIKLLHRYLAI